MNKKFFLRNIVIVLAAVALIAPLAPTATRTEAAEGTGQGQPAQQGAGGSQAGARQGGPLTPVGTGITYQGRLVDGNQPANGQYDLAFSLFDAASGGNMVSGPITLTNQTVTNGLFTVPLDFGTNAFQGDARWVQIAVGQSGNYTTLSPRQPLAAVPYAESLMPGATINSSAPANSYLLSVQNNGSGSAIFARGDSFYGVAAESNSGAGVYANSNTGVGVAGSSYSGYGVSGGSTNSYGVVGQGSYGGVFTDTNGSNVGVQGYSSHGYGVAGQSAYEGVYGSGQYGVVGSGSSIGMYGTSSGGTGVEGLSTTSGTGVLGQSTSGTGVQGKSNTSNAVQGTSTSGNGLLGKSTTGDGVLGMSSGSGVVGQGNYGVVGQGSYGGVFTDTNGTNAGVQGYSSNGYGVKGQGGLYGVYGNGQYGVVGGGSTGGVYGETANGFGVGGESPNGYGVAGQGNYGGVFTDTTGTNAGVQGYSSNGYGVSGQGGNAGVYGSDNGNGPGVYGQGTNGDGVYGQSTNGAGVNGESDTFAGVFGQSAHFEGVYGRSTALGGIGVFGENDSSNGRGVYGFNTGGGYGGYFQGNVEVTGNLSKGGGSFKIDDPIDPANKYLYHSFVESPDMMDIYNGNVTTDANGDATITMPAWFQPLNRDFRYQLTTIGQFAQAMVSSQMKEGQFSIKTDKPNVEVSWQVTGIRQDPYANAHRIPVEQDKSPSEQGKYLYPTEYGQPASAGINYQLNQQLQQQAQQAPQK